MPIKIYWYVKDKIVLLDMIDKVTEYEYATMIHTSPANQDHGYPIHTISTTENLQQHPEAMPSIKFLSKQMPESQQPQWILLIPSANSSVGKFMVSVFMQILRLRFRFVDSVDDAIQTLQRIDPTLPELQPIESFDDLELIAHIQESVDKAS